MLASLIVVVEIAASLEAEGRVGRALAPLGGSWRLGHGVIALYSYFCFVFEDFRDGCVRLFGALASDSLADLDGLIHLGVDLFRNLMLSAPLDVCLVDRRLHGTDGDAVTLGALSVSRPRCRTQQSIFGVQLVGQRRVLRFILFHATFDNLDAVNIWDGVSRVLTLNGILSCRVRLLIVLHVRSRVVLLVIFDYLPCDVGTEQVALTHLHALIQVIVIHVVVQARIATVYIRPHQSAICSELVGTRKSSRQLCGITTSSKLLLHALKVICFATRAKDRLTPRELGVSRQVGDSGRQVRRRSCTTVARSRPTSLIVLAIGVSLSATLLVEAQQNVVLQHGCLFAFVLVLMSTQLLTLYLAVELAASLLVFIVGRAALRALGVILLLCLFHGMCESVFEFGLEGAPRNNLPHELLLLGERQT